MGSNYQVVFYLKLKDILLEYIDEDNLPSIFGGSCTCSHEGGCVPGAEVNKKLLATTQSRRKSIIPINRTRFCLIVVAEVAAPAQEDDDDDTPLGQLMVIIPFNFRTKRLF